MRQIPFGYTPLIGDDIDMSIIKNQLPDLLEEFNDQYRKTLVEAAFTSYLFSEPTFFVDYEVDIEGMNRRFLNLNNRLRRIVRRYDTILENNKFPFRVVMKDSSFYGKIQLVKTSTGEGKIIVYGSLFHNDHIESQSFMLPVIGTFSEKPLIYNALAKKALIHGKNPTAKDEYDYIRDDTHASIRFITLMTEGIYQLADTDIDQLNFDDEFNYSDSELKLFTILQKDFMKMQQLSNGQLIKIIDHFGDERIPGYEYSPHAMTEEYFATNVQPSDPVIDLTEREFSFVYDYAVAHGFDRNSECDMYRALITPRYGYRLHYPLRNGKQVLMFDTEIELRDDESCILTMVHKCSFGNMIFKFDFQNLKHFTVEGFKSVRSAAVYITMDECVIHNNTEVLREAPDKLGESLRFIGYGYDVMALYLLMFDRPERIQQVSVTKDQEYKQKVSRNGRTRVEKKSKTVVISRILKTPAKAKKYVAEQTKKGRADAHYVLEEWDRRGHYRTLRSGKTVWIPATTCHRREKMNDDTSVIIKL